MQIKGPGPLITYVEYVKILLGYEDNVLIIIVELPISTVVPAEVEG